MTKTKLKATEKKWQRMLDGHGVSLAIWEQLLVEWKAL